MTGTRDEILDLKVRMGRSEAHGAKSKSALYVTPGSEQVHLTIQRDGQMANFNAIGATVLANACGPCIGQWKRDDIQAGESNSIISSYNRNFRRRNDGNPETLSFIGSPEIVIAYALAGTLAFNPLADELEAPDGTRYRLNPPAPAPEVPEAGFVATRLGYIEPPAERSGARVEVSPTSERLQLLEPFAAWDGNDYLEIPLLLKAKGGMLDEFAADIFSYVNSAGGTSSIDRKVPDHLRNVYRDVVGRFYDQLTRAHSDGCEGVQIVAHSLGTVVTYHALRGLGFDEIGRSDKDAIAAAAAHIELVYTIGSPLEKIRG